MRRVAGNRRLRTALSDIAFLAMILPVILFVAIFVAWVDDREWRDERW